MILHLYVLGNQDWCLHLESFLITQDSCSVWKSIMKRKMHFLTLSMDWSICAQSLHLLLDSWILWDLIDFIFRSDFTSSQLLSVWFGISSWTGVCSEQKRKVSMAFEIRSCILHTSTISVLQLMLSFDFYGCLIFESLLISFQQLCMDLKGWFLQLLYLKLIEELNGRYSELKMSR